MTRPATRHLGRYGVAVLVLAVILLVVFWDWNWFRPLVERQASAALGRPITLQHFDIKLRWHPWIIADGIAIANPPEFPKGSELATVQRLAIHVDPWAWFHGRVSLLDIEIDKPMGDLGPGPSGKPNYQFDALQSKDQKPTGKPLAIDIGRLVVHDGDVHIVEPNFKSDFRLKIHTEDNAQGRAGSTEPTIHVDIDGRYADAPISGRFIGGSVLTLRDAAHPYPVDLLVKNGATQVTLKGTLLDPLRFGGAKLKLDFRGQNIADLYPLTGVPLPPSPPYEIAGDLDYDRGSGAIRFRNVDGHYGQSDIAGDVSVMPAHGDVRRRVTIDAHSKQVVWSDLGGFIGATPGAADAPNDSAAQKSQRKAQAKTGKLLPDTPIALPRIRAADLDVRYKVAKVVSDTMPLDSLDGHLVITDGDITVKPLRLGVGKGSALANIELDGRHDPLHAQADVDFRELDFSKVMNKLSVFRGTGKIGGSMTFDAHGNSLAALLGDGDGSLKLFMTGGDVSALLVNLAGLDLGNSLISALGLPRRAQMRCMVADLGMQGGVVDTKTLLFDTTEANILGDGTIDLGKEKLDYTLRTQPKRMNIGSLAAPIDITGSLRAPHIMPNPGALAVRGGAAVALGVLLTPLAALLPTIQLGLGPDNDCAAMIHDLQAGKPVPPPKRAK
ncbi:AsmA family protein [Solimonas marina]|uniref:AsmA family protein n=1 Tax=Solimonas marina TaxID=2714601 RepID=A0A970BAD4_9GAMM|nr:AsmA family protein [Solimonas marina]NKF24279.1 AsmA family protein [Solimonas marina]